MCLYDLNQVVETLDLSQLCDKTRRTILEQLNCDANISIYHASELVQQSKRTSPRDGSISVSEAKKVLAIRTCLHSPPNKRYTPEPLSLQRMKKSSGFWYAQSCGCSINRQDGRDGHRPKVSLSRFPHASLSAYTDERGPEGLQNARATCKTLGPEGVPTP